MNLLNKLILTVAVVVAGSVTAEARYRRNYSSNHGYSNNTVQSVPQPQTVFKPVVTAPVTATVTKTPVKTVSYSSSSPTVAAPAAEIGQIESEIVAQTNAQRARYGLRPLAICPNLLNSARRHCQWMASANSLSHTSAPVAENIAAGQNSPSEALNSWMNSSGHRANILGGGYSTIGVAAYTGSNGQTYWCQQFR